MNEFVDFEELVFDIRLRMDRVVNNLFVSEYANTGYKLKSIDCSDATLQISTYKGAKSVKEIRFDEKTNTKTIITSDDVGYDYTDLSTDDMAAIYEFVYHALNTIYIRIRENECNIG